MGRFADRLVYNKCGIVLSAVIVRVIQSVIHESSQLFVVISMRQSIVRHPYSLVYRILMHFKRYTYIDDSLNYTFKSLLSFSDKISYTIVYELVIFLDSCGRLPLNHSTL